MFMSLVLQASAHSSERVMAKSSGCPDNPQIHSWHIHVLFWPDGAAGNNNTHNGVGAVALRKKFIDKFELEFTPNCTSLSDVNQGLCPFEIDYKPGFGHAGPFLVPNFAIFVPLDRFDETVPWMMMNRGDYDVLVHPNSESGCMYQDHIDHSVWSGNKWELKVFP
jgi:aromatic ring-cleaving dioxygenase